MPFSWSVEIFLDIKNQTLFEFVDLVPTQSIFIIAASTGGTPNQGRRRLRIIQTIMVNHDGFYSILQSCR